MPPDLNSLKSFAELDPKYAFVVDALNFMTNTLLAYQKMQYKTIFISFNGGKDATIALYLTYLALYNISISKEQNSNQYDSSTFENLPKIRTIYFEEPDPFPESIEFMNSIKNLFQLEEIKVSKDFKKSLHYLVNEYDLQAVIMGSRRVDPYCEKLQLISPSDTNKGYPPFLRINPIIDWTYEQVWQFLKDFQIPYCSLYEKGFSYISNSKNTLQNTHLINKEDGKIIPAWQISGKHEQGSRIIVSQQNNIPYSICLVFASAQKFMDLSSQLQESKQIYDCMITFNTSSEKFKIEKSLNEFNSFISSIQSSPSVEVFAQKDQIEASSFQSQMASINNVSQINYI